MKMQPCALITGASQASAQMINFLVVYADYACLLCLLLLYMNIWQASNALAFFSLRDNYLPEFFQGFSESKMS